MGSRMKDTALHRVFSLAFALCVAVSYCVAPFSFAYADEVDNATNYRVYSWLTSVTGSQLVEEGHYNFLLTHSYDDYVVSYGANPVYDEDGQPANVAAVVDRFRREYPSSYQAVAGGQGQTLDINGFGSLSFVPIQGYGERAVRDAQSYYSRHYVANELVENDPNISDAITSKISIVENGNNNYFNVDNAMFNYSTSSPMYRHLNALDLNSSAIAMNRPNMVYATLHVGSTDIPVILSASAINFYINGWRNERYYPVIYTDGSNLFLIKPPVPNGATAISSGFISLFQTNGIGYSGSGSSAAQLSFQFSVSGPDIVQAVERFGSNVSISYHTGLTTNVIQQPSGNKSVNGLSDSSPLVYFRENVANYDSEGAGDSFSQIVDSAGDINAPVFNIGPGGSADVVIGVPDSTSDPLPQWDVAVQTLEQLATNVEDIGETGNAILWEVTGFHKDMNSAWHRLFIDSFEMLYEYLDTIAYLLKMPNVPSDPFTFDEPDNPATLGGLSALFESFMAYTPLAVIQSIRGQFMMVFESGSGSGPLTDTQLSYDYSLDVAGHDVDVHGDIAQMDADGTLQRATRAATSIAFILACAALIIRYTSFIHRVLG